MLEAEASSFARRGGIRWDWGLALESQTPILHHDGERARARAVQQPRA